MTAQPEWLIEKEITLPDGTTALWSYDTEGDMLEVFFNQGAATCTVELADGVLLRLDLKQARPLSLALLSFTPLTQQREFGPPLLRLDGLDDLPDDIRQAVLQIITSPPVNAILKVFSYAPTLEADRVEPLALLEQPVAMPI